MQPSSRLQKFFKQKTSDTTCYGVGMNYLKPI